MPHRETETQRYDHIKLGERDIRSGLYFTHCYVEDQYGMRHVIMRATVGKDLSLLEVNYLETPVRMDELKHMIGLVEHDASLGWRDDEAERVIWLDKDVRIENHFFVRDAVVVERDGDNVTIVSESTTFVVKDSELFSGATDMRGNDDRYA